MNLPYYANVRQDVIDLIPEMPLERVLEIGGGDFPTLLTMRGVREFESWGVDIRDTDANLDHVVIGSVTDHSVHSQLPDGAFDLIIANDVIEHIVDTEAFASVIHSKLRVGGMLAISVPNARQIRLAYHVFLRGRFPRTDAGLFDRTHVRWFCKKDVLDLFGEYDLVSFRTVGRMVPSSISRTMLAEFLGLQNIFCFKKTA